jgi:hypothetical protein
MLESREVMAENTLQCKDLLDRLLVIFDNVIQIHTETNELLQYLSELSEANPTHSNI